MARILVLKPAIFSADFPPSNIHFRFLLQVNHFLEIAQGDEPERFAVGCDCPLAFAMQPILKSFTSQLVFDVLTGES
jgi:hypothetical protein